MKSYKRWKKCRCREDGRNTVRVYPVKRGSPGRKVDRYIFIHVGKDPAKIYRAFLEAADSLATGVLEGMQDREAEKSQQRQVLDAFNQFTPSTTGTGNIIWIQHCKLARYDQERATPCQSQTGVTRWSGN